MPDRVHNLPIRQMLADADEAWRLYDRPGVWLGINNRELLGNLACHVRALVQALDRITCLLRCEITHNPCGTDTWPEGYQCQCRPCRVYVVKKSYMQSGPISEPQEATHGQATIEAQATPELVRQGNEPAGDPREVVCRDPETGKPRTYYRGEPGTPATVIGPWPEFDA